MGIILFLRNRECSLVVNVDCENRHEGGGKKTVRMTAKSGQTRRKKNYRACLRLRDVPPPQKSHRFHLPSVGSALSLVRPVGKFSSFMRATPLKRSRTTGRWQPLAAACSGVHLLCKTGNKRRKHSLRSDKGTLLWVRANDNKRCFCRHGLSDAFFCYFRF